MARSRVKIDRVSRSINILVEDAEWLLEKAEKEQRSFNYVLQNLITKARLANQAEAEKEVAE